MTAREVLFDPIPVSLPGSLLPVKEGLTKEERRQICFSIRRDLVNDISRIIRAIKDKLAEADHHIGLTLSNIIVLTLHLPVYIRAHLDIDQDLLLAIDFISNSPSFYLRFPLMEESLFIEAICTADEISI
jgi:hypothetical protein